MMDRYRSRSDRYSNPDANGDIWEQAGYVRVNPDEGGFPILYRRRHEGVGVPRGPRVRIGRWFVGPHKYLCPSCGFESTKLDEIMEWRSPQTTDIKWHITLHCDICDLTWEAGREAEARRDILDRLGPGEERTNCSRCRRLGNLVCKCSARLGHNICPSCLGKLSSGKPPSYILERHDISYDHDRHAYCRECGKEWLMVGSGKLLEVITNEEDVRREEGYIEQERARLEEEFGRRKEGLEDRDKRIREEYEEVILGMFREREKVREEFDEKEDGLYGQLSEAEDSEYASAILDEIHDLKREKYRTLDDEDEKIDEVVAERSKKTSEIFFELGRAADRHGKRISKLEKRRIEKKVLRFEGDPEAVDVLRHSRNGNAGRGEDDERIEDMTADEFRDYADRKSEELSQEHEQSLRKMEQTKEELDRKNREYLKRFENPAFDDEEKGGDDDSG